MEKIDVIIACKEKEKKRKLKHAIVVSKLEILLLGN
jgi:hypothetical protein